MIQKRRFTIKQSVIDVFNADKLVRDRMKKPSGQVVYKREPATRLFHGRDVLVENGKNYLTFNGVKVAEIWEGQGCHWILLDYKTGVKYQLSIGKDTRDVFFENPTLTSTQIDEFTYEITAEETILNGYFIKDAPKNRDFKGAGFTWSIRGLRRTSENRYGKKYIGGNLFYGTEKSKITISTDPDSLADFILPTEEIEDSGREYVSMVAHTRAGALGKEHLTPISYNLEALCPNLYK